MGREVYERSPKMACIAAHVMKVNEWLHSLNEQLQYRNRRKTEGKYRRIQVAISLISSINTTMSNSEKIYPALLPSNASHYYNLGWNEVYFNVYKK